MTASDYNANQTHITWDKYHPQLGVDEHVYLQKLLGGRFDGKLVELPDTEPRRPRRQMLDDVLLQKAIITTIFGHSEISTEETKQAGRHPQ